MRTDNREALLAAAARCLESPGLSRTTARVVASEAGVSPAAIGYHFGTVRELMTTAALEATGRWGAGLVASLEQLHVRSASPVSRSQLWDAVVASFEGHRAGLLASYELLLLAQSDEGIRATVREQLDGAYLVLAASFEPDARRLPEDELRERGVAHYTILSGLMTQWLIAPDDVPGGDVLDRVLASKPMTAR